MIEATPTPAQLYDIADIPIFAYEPGLILWLLVAALALILILWAIFGFKNKIRKSEHLNAFYLCTQELSIIANQKSLGPKDLSKASLVVKRLLSRLYDIDYATLTARELEKQISRTKDALLVSILKDILDFDNLRYADKQQDLSAKVDLNQLHSNIIKLKHAYMEEQCQK